MIVDLAFQRTNWERFRHDLAVNARAELLGNVTNGRANELAPSCKESILYIAAVRKADKPEAMPNRTRSSS